MKNKGADTTFCRDIVSGNECSPGLEKSFCTDELISTSVFRKATLKDVPSVAIILKQAVDRMLAEGKRQWDNNYPNETHIHEDIKAGFGYVLEQGGEIAAYGAVVFDAEPAYSRIEGRWLSDEKYVVVHRMAVNTSLQRKGNGMAFLKEVENLALGKGINSFRVDTNFDNDRMLNLLEKAGFAYCGEIWYEKGSRKAFEKLLRKRPQEQ